MEQVLTWSVGENSHQLCIVGDRFQLYQGKPEKELMTVVNYIDEGSGEIFNTINSTELE